MGSSVRIHFLSWHRSGENHLCCFADSPPCSLERHTVTMVVVEDIFLPVVVPELVARRFQSFQFRSVGHKCIYMPRPSVSASGCGATLSIRSLVPWLRHTPFTTEIRSLIIDCQRSCHDSAASDVGTVLRTLAACGEECW